MVIVVDYNTLKKKMVIVVDYNTLKKKWKLGSSYSLKYNVTVFIRL